MAEEVPLLPLECTVLQPVTHIEDSIDARIASYVNRFRGNAFGEQIAPRAFGGRKMNCGETTGQYAV